MDGGEGELEGGERGREREAEREVRGKEGRERWRTGPFEWGNPYSHGSNGPYQTGLKAGEEGVRGLMLVFYFPHLQGSQ